MTLRKSLFLPLLLAFGVGLALDSTAGAEPDKKKKSSKKTAAKCLTPMLRRSSKDESWKAVRAKDSIPYGDLLLGGSGASLIDSKRAVQVSMLGDMAGLSPFPIIETALTLNRSAEENIDLDFTLDRGRVDLINKKKAGAVKVRVHVQKNAWDLTLSEPGARVAMELYGRWPRGMPFKKEPGPGYGPQLDVIVLVLKGHVDFKAGGDQFSLSQPPGPALIQWDNVNGWDKSPTPQEKLPDWADERASITPEGLAKKATLLKFSAKVRKVGLPKTLEAFLDSDDPQERRLAIYVLGATDDLQALGQVLIEAKHPDTWDNGVLALRHWIGRAPGQDQILYKALLESRKLSPARAETILQLLHSFSDTDLARPETYEVLIEYLGHEVLGIRGLAYWHLKRLVPAGQNIAYNPLDPPQARAKAQAEWRKLIPSGQLPPKAASPKSTPEKK